MTAMLMLSAPDHNKVKKYWSTSWYITH